MADMVRDPVCGMEVDPENAAGSSTYQGVTYYFCSEDCKRQFDADPSKYAPPPSSREAMPETAEMPMASKEQAAPKPRRWWEFWK